MNLRLPIIAAVVAVAGGAALWRGAHPASSRPAFVEETDAHSGSTFRRAPRLAGAASHGDIVVYVAGSVRHGGLYTLQPGARAADALRAAGGAASGADLVAVNLAEELSDGDEVAVPSLDDPSAPERSTRTHGSHRVKHRSHRHKKKRHHRHRHSVVASADATTGGGDAATAADPPASRVDLNTADASELETLPGVGATLAARIVSYRELTGAFASPDDLLDVAGITQSKLDAIEPYLSADAEKR